MGVKAKLHGKKAFMAALKREDARLARGFRKGAIAAAKALRDELKLATPVDTGALEASTLWFAEGTGWQTIVWVGQGGPVEGFYDDYGNEKIPEEYAVYRHEWERYDYRLWFDSTLEDLDEYLLEIVYEEMNK